MGEGIATSMYCHHQHRQGRQRSQWPTLGLTKHLWTTTRPSCLMTNSQGENHNVVLRDVHILLSPASPVAQRHLVADLTTSPDFLAGDMPTHKMTELQGVGAGAAAKHQHLVAEQPVFKQLQRHTRTDEHIYRYICTSHTHIQI